MPPLIVVTGQSGAGRTLALRALEDLGYFCVDNLPAALLPPLVDLVEGDPSVQGTAVAIDVRGGGFFRDAAQALGALTASGHAYRIVFLQADAAVLIQRYQATRRQHPLGRGLSLEEAIRREGEALQSLKARADVVVDTSRCAPRDLRARLAREFALDPAGLPYRVRILSFGFKYGIPLDADLVFDVRFLPNPHWVEALRPLSGLDERVRRYVLDHPAGEETVRRLTELLAFLVPQYRQEGRTQVSLAVGCTGGYHRSVVVAEELARRLAPLGTAVDVEHRDVGAESSA